MVHDQSRQLQWFTYLKSKHFGIFWVDSLNQPPFGGPILFITKKSRSLYSSFRSITTWPQKFRKKKSPCMWLFFPSPNAALLKNSNLQYWTEDLPSAAFMVCFDVSLRKRFERRRTTEVYRCVIASSVRQLKVWHIQVSCRAETTQRTYQMKYSQ